MGASLHGSKKSDAFATNNSGSDYFDRDTASLRTRHVANGRPGPAVSGAVVEVFGKKRFGEPFLSLGFLQKGLGEPRQVV